MTGQTPRLLLILAALACSRTPAADTEHLSHPATPARAAAARPTVIVSAQKSIPLRVGGDVSAPVPISRVEPDYSGCIGKQVWGFPILEGVIDETGRVRNLRLLKKVHPCLEAAVLPAIRQWRFKPGTFRGKPVPVIYNMTVNIHYR